MAIKITRGSKCKLKASELLVGRAYIDDDGDLLIVAERNNEKLLVHLMEDATRIYYFDDYFNKMGYEEVDINVIVHK